MVLGDTPVLTCCRPPPLPPQDQVSQSAGLPPLPGLKLLRHQLLPHYTVLREGAASAAHRPHTSSARWDRAGGGGGDFPGLSGLTTMAGGTRPYDRMSLRQCI